VIPQYRPDHHGKHGGHPHHGHDQGNDTLLSNHTMTPAERCAGFPKLDDILIVIKTGASEAYAKVPIQFMTFLQCVEDNVLVFSDMEQELGPYHVYDSLDQVTEAAKKDNPDFDLYRMQQEFKHDGNEIASTLHGQKNDDAWRLDKYKNIHIATKSYDMRPEASWYIFIDADTYIVWSSLLPWLGGMDPDKPLYMGSKAMMGDMGFAHGGSGYVLSHKAMEKFVGEDPGVANRYDEPAIHECCGDVNLAVALYDKDIVKLDSYWPMINGESPRTIPFGPSHWCQPIITMHHISVQHTNDFWWFEQSRLDPEVCPPIPTTLTPRSELTYFSHRNPSSFMKSMTSSSARTCAPGAATGTTKPTTRPSTSRPRRTPRRTRSGSRAGRRCRRIRGRRTTGASRLALITTAAFSTSGSG
jgi:hypothetical protein